LMRSSVNTHGGTRSRCSCTLFNPTNNKLAGNEDISVAVAREQEKASPLSGTWTGPASAFSSLDVSVQVTAI
jgi:hypothetical protein